MNGELEIGDIGFGHEDTSNNKFRSISASLLATAKVANLAAMVESVMHVCLVDAQDIIPPPSKYI